MSAQAPVYNGIQRSADRARAFLRRQGGARQPRRGRARPGAARPQETSERQQAEEALAPQLALGAPKGEVSAGQQALLAQIGAPASPDIRRKIDQDAAQDAGNEGFVDKLLYWRKPNTNLTQVDPGKESQRLRQNAALGQGPEVGDTPIIQQRKTGWFSSLFSWL